MEDAYFMSGTANVYEEGENFTARTIFESAPYTTRVLVRRPGDSAKFSGNVAVEILNATALDIKIGFHSSTYASENAAAACSVLGGDRLSMLPDYDGKVSKRLYEPFNFVL